MGRFAQCWLGWFEEHRKLSGAHSPTPLRPQQSPNKQKRTWRWLKLCTNEYFWSIV